MSYDSLDSVLDEMYDQISRDLYPEHKAQAISEFTAERLRSFYVANPQVIRPAIDAIQEGKRLATGGHSAAAIVFFVTAIKILLKANLLKPVVPGLVNTTAWLTSSELTCPDVHNAERRTWGAAWELTKNKGLGTLGGRPVS